MADIPSYSIAIAGSGEITEENLAALLNDFLGFGEEDADGFYAESPAEISLYLPAGKAWSNKQLDKVVDWSAKADLPYVVVLDGSKGRAVAKTVEEASDVRDVDAGSVAGVLIDLLAADREAPGTEVYLLTLWGDEDPGDEMNDLLEVATGEGIRILDLTAGLDDIILTDEDAPVAEPEPEPEPEPVKAPRGRKRKAAEVQEPVEEPLEEVDHKAVAAAAKADGERRKAEALQKANDNLEAKKTAKEEETPWAAVNEGEEAILLRGEDLEAFKYTLHMALSYHAATDQSNAAGNLAPEVKHRPLTLAIHSLLQFLEGGLVEDTPSEAPGSTESDEPAKVEPQADEGPKRGRGRPRKDGTPAQPKDPDEKNIGIIQRGDGTFRKRGRGRPRKGEIQLLVSENELAEMEVDEEES